MKNILVFLALSFSVIACYSIETKSHYNKELTWGHSESDPIHLSFQDTKNSLFYFVLSRNTKYDDYKIKVRWHNPSNNDLLFNGYDSTLKFLINNEKILSFHPIKKPRIVSYNLNSKGHEEEALFSLTSDEFNKIAFAKDVSVELNGRYKTVIGYFNRRNSLKAFQDFAKNSL